MTGAPERATSPTVDVVILSWDRGRSTLEAVASARAQEGVATRVWVVDQGSGADCLEGLRAAARDDDAVTLVELGRNLGVAGGRNHGMSLGSAELIVALDNDAVFEHVRTVAAAADRFIADGSLAALGFRIMHGRTGRDDEGSWAYPRQLKARRDEPFYATRFCGAAHMIRRAALAATQGYDDALFFYWEELDLSYQLIQAGYRIGYEPSARALHFTGAEQRTHWEGDRFYYLVRNALYLEWKYFRSPRRLSTLAAGYQLKGLRNGVLRQSVRAVVDGLAMMRAIPADVRPLGPEARDYIRKHDTSHRGGLLRRLRTEALERVG